MDGVFIQRNVFPQSQRHARLVRQTVDMALRVEQQRRLVACPRIGKLTRVDIQHAIQGGHELGRFFEPGDVPVHTPQDLTRLARVILKEELFGLAAGSAGLALALGALLPWRRRRLPRPAAGAPLLVVVGSQNPTNLAQIRWLEEHGHVPTVCACIREVVAGRDRFRHELDRTASKARSELRAGRDAILTLAQPAASGRRRTPSPSTSATLSEFAIIGMM